MATIELVTVLRIRPVEWVRRSSGREEIQVTAFCGYEEEVASGSIGLLYVSVLPINTVVTQRHRTLLNVTQ
jgi:hypothetical protein